MHPRAEKAAAASADKCKKKKDVEAHPKLHDAGAMATSTSDMLGQVLVISGGSGYNDLVGATPNAIFVLPGTSVHTHA